jgi:uncharacterized protein (TIGR03067 family)
MSLEMGRLAMRATDLFLATAILLLGFAPAPFPKPSRGKAGGAREELKKMQGTWVVHQALGGTTFHQKDLTAVIRGDRLKYLLHGKVRTEWVIILDTSRTPKVFDHKRVGGNDILRGIYRVQGDTFIICYRQESAESRRPTAFDGSKPDIWVSTFQRQTAEN